MVATEKKYVKAVDHVTFQIKKGEILALVGESGCGKTTTGRTLLRLEDATGGEILYKGQPVQKFSGKELREYRKKAQIIFQDPYNSINPKQTIFDIVAEPLEVNSVCSSEREKEERVITAISEAGLRPATEYLYRYPHELSGGQRQRVCIAGATVLDPDVIVADEPVASLDVSIRNDILKLMVEEKEKLGVTYIFITHDLSLAWVISDRIAVMYLGRIVEIGETEEVVANPKHPYTKALISVIPVPDPLAKREHVILKGETPNPVDIPSGLPLPPALPGGDRRLQGDRPGGRPHRRRPLRRLSQDQVAEEGRPGRCAVRRSPPRPACVRACTGTGTTRRTDGEMARALRAAYAVALALALTALAAAALLAGAGFATASPSAAPSASPSAPPSPSATAGALDYRHRHLAGLRRREPVQLLELRLVGVLPPRLRLPHLVRRRLPAGADLASSWETSEDGLTWTFHLGRAWSGRTGCRSPPATSPSPTTSSSRRASRPTSSTSPASRTSRPRTTRRS